jgi:hypothetical protein
MNYPIFKTIQFAFNGENVSWDFAKYKDHEVNVACKHPLFKEIFKSETASSNCLFWLLAMPQRLERFDNFLRSMYRSALDNLV